MLKNDLSSALESIAKDWKKAKRQADKQDRVSAYTLNRMMNRPARVSIREAAFDAMEAAYLKASDNGARHDRTQIRVFSVTFKNTPPARITGNIDHGRKSPFDASRCGLTRRN